MTMPTVYNMSFYVTLGLLCLYLLYVVVERVWQNYLDEFGIDKTQPLTIDVIEKVINLVVENKICSKFKKQLPPPPLSNDFYSSIKAAYFIVTCIVCALIGYISGIRKRKSRCEPVERNLFMGNGFSRTHSSDNNDPSTCSLCLNVFKPRMVLLPCKHICICNNCWIRFYEEDQLNCPICREIIEDVMGVYST